MSKILYIVDNNKNSNYKYNIEEDTIIYHFSINSSSEVTLNLDVSGVNLYYYYNNINYDDNTFKIVYDQKKKNKPHYKTFEVLASANLAKNTELKKYYIDKHRRTFNLSNLEQVIKIISINQTH